MFNTCILAVRFKVLSFRDKNEKNIHISWVVSISTSTATMFKFSSNIPNIIDTFVYFNTIHFIYKLVQCIINMLSHL